MGHHLQQRLQKGKPKKKKKNPVSREMEVHYGHQDLKRVGPVGALKGLQKYLHC